MKDLDSQIVEEVTRIVRDYCSREIKVCGSNIRYHSEVVERTLLGVNLKNLRELKTDAEVEAYMAGLRKSKSLS